MTEQRMDDGWPGTAAAYQDHILPQVSRTFALTIPQLPSGLRSAVANAYLLCRIADTIEDEPALSPADKRRFEEELVEVVTGRRAPAPFALEVAAKLSGETLESERHLMRNLPLVIQITAGFNPAQRAAIERCLAVMCRGMHHFQQHAGVHGVATQRDMDRYCYYVAGVVGEMLTDLFCDFDPAIAARRDIIAPLAISFGQALQMTNILKDQWEDRARGACWLPREVLRRHGVDLANLEGSRGSAGFAAAMSELVGVANAHLQRALNYTLAIPPEQTGIRRFCLWALGLAVLTLRNVNRNPGFASGAEVKVSRAAVARTIMITNLAVRHDALLRRLFEFTGRDLPFTALELSTSESLVLPTAQALHV